MTSAWNLVRVWSSVTLAAVLEKYAAWPGPIYIGATGAVFAGLGFVLLWSMWQRAVWAPRLLLGAAFGYATWYWIDRLCIQPALGASWPFSLVSTAVLLAFITAVALDPRNRNYFKKRGP